MSESTKDKAKRLLIECQVDPKTIISEPPIAISIGSKLMFTRSGKEVKKIPVGTYGNYSFIQAPPKSKKTYFVSLLVAAYLETNKYSAHISGTRNGKKIIHFDTEQSDYHASTVFRRPIDMCTVSDNYYTFALRELDVQEKILIIEECLEQTKDIGLLVIDGIADLVYDVNNIEQSSALVNKLMKWSSKNNCHIVTVIHSNYGTTKPTGHLGSYLEKRCETQMQLELNDVHKDWVNVICKKSRGCEFDNFSFKINSYGIPEVIKDIYDPLHDFNKNSKAT